MYHTMYLECLELQSNYNLLAYEAIAFADVKRGFDVFATCHIVVCFLQILRHGIELQPEI